LADVILSSSLRSVDLQRKVWEVPVTKKARGSAEGTGKPFIVPLSPQAVAVLKLLQPFSSDSDYVFPGESPQDPRGHAARVHARSGLIYTSPDMDTINMSAMMRSMAKVKPVGALRTRPD
jgi:integrase